MTNWKKTEQICQTTHTHKNTKQNETCGPFYSMQIATSALHENVNRRLLFSLLSFSEFFLSGFKWNKVIIGLYLIGVA